MKLMQIPPDVLLLTDTLPKSVLDDIQIQLVIFSGLYAIGLGPKQPRDEDLIHMLNKTTEKYIQLLRAAGVQSGQSSDEQVNNGT